MHPWVLVLVLWLIVAHMFYYIYSVLINRGSFLLPQDSTLHLFITPVFYTHEYFTFIYYTCSCPHSFLVALFNATYIVFVLFHHISWNEWNMCNVRHMLSFYHALLCLFFAHAAQREIYSFWYIKKWKIKYYFNSIKSNEIIQSKVMLWVKRMNFLQIILQHYFSIFPCSLLPVQWLARQA